jgi:class 3 adenylate cyclase
LILLGVAFVYTIALFILFRYSMFFRVLSFASSTVDIILITTALYFSRYDPDSSVASIVSSGAFAVYAPIIIFSIRRHDALNTLYTGLISAVSYITILIVIAQENVFDVRMVSETGLVITHDFTNEFIKVIMLGLTGVLGYITARNFNTVFLKGLQEQREKEHIRSTFGRYVSDALVEKILTNEIPTDGEKRDVTVMFIDIKNFTSLSERVTPQTLIKILNIYFSYCISIIRKHNGFIDKLIGDAIMVEFGAPIYHRRHRENAVRCARELCQFSTKLEEEIRNLGVDWKLEFGIGINSGDVVLGNVGTSQRMEYTALGDTVNTASRIEGLTKRFGKPIIVGEQTLTEELESVLEKGQVVQVRGKATPIKVYAVIL